MVHFALIQISRKHTEILGTFIEIILKNKWNLTIYYNLEQDEYTFVRFYKNLFESDLIVKSTNTLNDDIENIDYFIYSSSTDEKKMPEIFKNTDLAFKTIYIQHQAPHFQKFMLKNIVVSPVIKSEELNKTQCEYLLPIYKSYKKLHWSPLNKTTIFAIIGGIRTASNGKILDRNLELINEILTKYPKGDYEFWFFMRKYDWIWISRKYKFLRENPKIFGFPGLDTDLMVKSLRRAKFILPLAKKQGWFYWQRLTGSIPLAINFNIPMIMDKELAEIYNLQETSLIYKDSILEIYDDIMNIKDEDYYKLVEANVKYKIKCCKENEKKLINLCLKQISNKEKTEFNNSITL